MAATEKRVMPDNTTDQSSKRRKKQQNNKAIIESGDWGVFVTCDMGRESKCIAEALDLFSQVTSSNAGGEDSGSDEDEGDIEAQIRKEIESLKPRSAKPRQFQAIRMEMPCVTFIRFDKSIDPEKLVHDVCLDAHANPEKKRCRWVQRMTPVRSIRKTLSVDLEAFAKEILKPHFHSGGPPKKYAIRPTIRGNNKFDRDSVIKTIADVVGPEHPVDLKNYDLIILVHLIQNVVGISVAGSDYDKLKRYNLAELYTPTPKPQAPDNSGV
ncbi:THUMP domain protein [Aspergillus fumigatus Af293]|uniref:THUMP domain protein n=1 Tax=Aspergillus fumigatus (strain ATCC MYA-4609 / CBS 101355 / FGSC A1100 / Af293) TaxID=330879 RepID=Q4WXX8_ASPFU|nr:THUMP domain protein [Aspergillus fumigatus Af293]EAL92475.1 THUMP domain protein [Aspergillus fumigatus Af293]